MPVKDIIIGTAFLLCMAVGFVAGLTTQPTYYFEVYYAGEDSPGHSTTSTREECRKLVATFKSNEAEYLKTHPDERNMPVAWCTPN